MRIKMILQQNRLHLELPSFKMRSRYISVEIKPSIITLWGPFIHSFIHFTHSIFTILTHDFFYIIWLIVKLNHITALCFTCNCITTANISFINWLSLWLNINIVEWLETNEITLANFFFPGRVRLNFEQAERFHWPAVIISSHAWLPYWLHLARNRLSCHS